MQEQREMGMISAGWKEIGLRDRLCVIHAWMLDWTTELKETHQLQVVNMGLSPR